MGKQSGPAWATRSNLALAVFLVAGGYFLWAEHRVHVIEYLPWLLVLACIGMHFFMHGGHGHGGHERRGHHGDDAVSERSERERGS